MPWGVVSYPYKLPVGQGEKYSLGPANWIIGNWQTDGILTFASGPPFSVFCCSRRDRNDLSGNPFSDRLHANAGPPSGSFHKSLTEEFASVDIRSPLSGPGAILAATRSGRP